MTSKEHIPYLDGWRGIAIALVLYSHFLGSESQVWVGRLGVQFFFVLSGFLMGGILFIKRPPLPDFFARRFIRIMPPFLLYVLCVLVFVTCFQAKRYVPSAAELFAVLTFLRTYVPFGASIFSRDWPIGHLWSLNVEEHCYLALALVAFCTRRYRSPWIAGAILATLTFIAFAFSHRYFNHPDMSGTPGVVRTESAALGLLAGVTIRYFMHFGPARFSALVPAWVPLVCVALAVVSSAYRKGIGSDIMVAPIALACAINFLDRTPAVLRDVLSNPSLRWLGTASFSLYLWQQPFYLHLLNGGSDRATMGLAALAVGAFAFHAFERPVRRRMTQAWQQRKAVQLPVVIDELAPPHEGPLLY